MPGDSGRSQNITFKILGATNSPSGGYSNPGVIHFGSHSLGSPEGDFKHANSHLPGHTPDQLNANLRR